MHKAQTHTHPYQQGQPVVWDNVTGWATRRTSIYSGCGVRDGHEKRLRVDAMTPATRRTPEARGHTLSASSRGLFMPNPVTGVINLRFTGSRLRETGAPRCPRWKAGPSGTGMGAPSLHWELPVWLGTALAQSPPTGTAHPRKSQHPGNQDESTPGAALLTLFALEDIVLAISPSR